MKPVSRVVLACILLLFFLFVHSAVASDDPTSKTASTVEVDLEDEFLELLEIDEQEEEEKESAEGNEKQHLQDQKGTEVLSKAQKIILELDSDNVKQVIGGNDSAMVLGYAPWCSRSAELMPKFAEAANKLKELGSRILMAKIDADRHPKVASSIGIRGFPSLLLFVNGSSDAYKGDYSWQNIVIWARKKTGFPINRINSVMEAQVFLNQYPNFVFGLFDKFEGNSYVEFVKAAKAENDTQFVEVNSLEVAKVLFPDIGEATLFLGLVKSEPEKYSRFDGNFKMQEILRFIELNKFPLVTKLTSSNSLKIFNNPIKLQVMIFADNVSLSSLITPLQEAARKYKSKFLIIYVNIAEENMAKPFLSLFGFQDRNDTVVVAFDNNKNIQYSLDLDPTPSNINDFCAALVAGTLTRHYKSQPIPDNSGANVHVIVGKTFDELVLKSPKHVLLEVYTPWCKLCESASKKVEKLGKHFKDWDNVLIAKIDASQNEHPELDVEDYPTLLLYISGQKENPSTLIAGATTRDLAGSMKYMIKSKDEL